jgi:hypothetical protein
LNLEERILLVVPTLFFFVTVAWGYIFQQLTFNEVRVADGPHYHRIRALLSPHFHQMTYTDAIFVFMVNGIVWILQLYRTGLGVIVMVIGIVVAVTGLLSTFMWRYKHGSRVSTVALLATMMVAAIEFALFILIP